MGEVEKGVKNVKKHNRPPAYWLPYALRASARRVTWKHRQKQKNGTTTPDSDRAAADQNAERREKQG